MFIQPHRPWLWPALACFASALATHPSLAGHDFNRNVNFNLFRADALWRITPTCG